METVSLTTEELQTLERAIRRDIALGNFGRTVFLEEGASYDDVTCQFNIRLYYTAQPGANGEPDSGPVDSAVSLNLSTYCTETLKALQGLKTLQDGPWQMLTDREYYDLEDLEKNGGSGYEDYYEDPYGVVYPDTHAVYPGDAYVDALPAGMSEEVF